MRVLLGVIALAAVLVAGCGDEGNDDGAAAPRSIPDTMDVTSPAFGDGDTIPVAHSCEGEGVSPHLAWSDPPIGTVELALVVDDPAAPGGTYLHWVVTGIKAGATGVGPGGVPEGGTQHETSAGEEAYAPMCPPEGDDPHTYRFTVYALPAVVDVPAGTDPNDAVERIEAKAAARGTLTGRFSR